MAGGTVSGEIDVQRTALPAARGGTTMIPVHGTGHRSASASADGVEWMMVGRDVPAGKRLYASRNLTGTDFRLAVDQHMDGQGWLVSSVLANMLIIDRPTYGECLAAMARIWANWDSAQAAGELEQGT